MNVWNIYYMYFNLVVFGGGFFKIFGGVLYCFYFVDGEIKVL